MFETVTAEEIVMGSIFVAVYNLLVMSKDGFGILTTFMGEKNGATQFLVQGYIYLYWD